MPAPSLSVAVQHHPARAGILPPLLAKLGRADVVADPEPGAPPSPWRCYRAALEATPAAATHRLVVQDDASPCRGFLDAARAAVAARPDRVVAFFVAGNPLEHRTAVWAAARAGEPWAILRNDRWLSAVATCWPAELAADAVRWTDAMFEREWPASFTADDEILGRYLRHAGVEALATVPSLVQHPDVEASLVGRRTAYGHDHGRVAACWIPDDCDPARIDWSLGPR